MVYLLKMRRSGTLYGIILFVVFINCNVALRAQTSNDTSHSKYLSIGPRRAGICFGNSHKYTGLRFNLVDRKVKRVNIFNLAFITKTRVMNGLSVGIAVDNDSIGNGLAFSIAFTGGEHRNGVTIGGLACGQQVANGFALGGIYYTAHFLNGIGIGGGWCILKKANGFAFGGAELSADTLNGLFVGGGVECGRVDTINERDTSFGRMKGVAIALWETEAVKLTGLAISILYTHIIKQHGVSIAIYNNSSELHGLQIGLLNHAANNPKGLQWLPFINMHFGKSSVASHQSTVKEKQ